MPIKPFELQSNSNNQYQTIADEEDVTPIDRSITKKAKKSFKYIMCGIIIVIISTLLLFLCLIYNTNIISNPIIYQTTLSEDNNHNMKELTIQDIINNNINIKTINFGNIKCNKQDNNYYCNNSNNITPAVLTVNEKIKYQKIVGFGGAFTEATAINFFELPEDKQEEILDLYFGKDGIHLTMGRVHINSCDFSPKSYSFDEIPNDYDLEYFDWEVTHDNQNILPLIRLAIMKLQSYDNHDNLKLVASPWSPPAWMKVPVDGVQSMTGSAYPNGLKNDPKVMLAWARYISKFIGAYAYKGVPIWAVTPQNEPEFPAPWEACAFNSSFEYNFIRDYLGPVLQMDHPDLLLLGFDHNKDHLESWTRTLITKDTDEYIDGMAFHWYGGLDRVTDGTYGYDAINASYHYSPNKLLINTEACSCPNIKINNYLRAERVGHDIMFDLNNYANGWIDWNLLVDYKGGPNHLNNFCDASLITNKIYNNYIIQPKYYYLGHFSKFIKPNSIRINSNIIGNYNYELIDPNIQNNIEITINNCEKSTRQLWILNNNNLLQLLMKANYDDNSGYDYLCVARDNIINYNDQQRNVLTLANCDLYNNNNGTNEVIFLEIEYKNNNQLYDKITGMCISLRGDVREPGALLELQPCITHNNNNKHKNKDVSHQYFYYDTNTKELLTPQVNNLCLTAGWPFLNTVAFKDSNNKNTIIVVMNEAEVSSFIILEDKIRHSKPMGFTINPRSIQTIIY